VIDKLIEFLVSILDLFRFWQVLNPYERGVQLRLGTFRRELGPGIHWVLPFRIDRVLHDNVVPRVVALGAQTLVTKDRQTIGVTAVVTASIRHIQKALLEVEGVDHALADACMAGVAAHVAASTWDELRTDECSERLTKACRAQAFRYGVEIHRVQLADLCPSRSIRLHGLDQRVTPSI
jgi:regulator of protease activity HflC (stomatin/prohibitin superfamily)